VEAAVKLSPLICVLACSAALSQETVPPRVHTVATGTDFVSIGFAADSIVKEDGPTRYDSLIHLRGNVEIRTCCVQLPARNQAKPGNPNPPRRYMIMRADEVDYDGEKGEIEARGTVRVSFQNPK
jgi:lipopolysaccharide assembly outer membrane protein LptD (OstA)